MIKSRWDVWGAGGLRKVLEGALGRIWTGDGGSLH